VGDLAVLLGVEVAEGEVFKLPLDLPDAEAVGEGGVDLHRLARLATAMILRHGVHRAHVVEAVGELDDDDADILGHGEEHLAQVLGVGGVHGGGAELDGLELGGAVDEAGDLGVEAVGELGGGDAAILLDIVEEGGGDGVGVELEGCDGLGGVEGVDDVGLAGLAELAVVLFGGEEEGALDEVDAFFRQVLAHLREQGCGVYRKCCHRRRNPRVLRKCITSTPPPDPLPPLTRGEGEYR
jgi:hypothetical protein